MRALWILVVTAIILFFAKQSAAVSTDEMNAANNPLQPSLGVNVQDQYVGRYYDLDSDVDSNAFLLRGILPHKTFGTPQILRATMPVVTTPNLPPDGRHTDAGDLNLFDLFLFKAGSLELGIGPQLTIPTAGRADAGTGKWQGGLATVVIAPQSWGLAGGLITWQQSFAGGGGRRDQNNLQAQPFVIRNLPHGWYVRSTAIWTWDLQEGSYYLPLGIGAGKVWKAGNTTLNLFAEPQWTVAHDGDGVPQFQVFVGFNLQFPL